MYYLKTRGIGSHPTPAESPSLCNPGELHEWEYAQAKHRFALTQVKGQVDNSQPKSINPAAQRVQVATRKFFEDQRRAEIGRINQKMVQRLGIIARGEEPGYDPRSPPRESNGRSNAPPYKKGLSLTEIGRRQARRAADEGNALLVRRLLKVQGTFDRAKDELEFRQHQRTSLNLQRLPDRTRSQSLPQLPSTTAGTKTSSVPLPKIAAGNKCYNHVHCGNLKGLDMLLLPGSLQKVAASEKSSKKLPALDDATINGEAAANNSSNNNDEEVQDDPPTMKAGTTSQVNFRMAPSPAGSQSRRAGEVSGGETSYTSPTMSYGGNTSRPVSNASRSAAGDRRSPTATERSTVSPSLRPPTNQPTHSVSYGGSDDAFETDAQSQSRSQMNETGYSTGSAAYDADDHEDDDEDEEDEQSGSRSSSRSP
eukprot:CAMPEP_0206586178 /NCGR_PEP_ID=MMETSP0325_2-20121206/36863_1 /ASSEMBLY_ACC=CAM_ASM_000347 /TAXON_ID=2866 /ORGANISM="Crypthecodinium cohnii, Strain Seligo" /LENGTH=423 /DNA_ID=CAMNT_0054093877 /DNA_START=9 /DNA_END=1277 /DNA_ORIENTATION=+